MKVELIQVHYYNTTQLYRKIDKLFLFTLFVCVLWSGASAVAAVSGDELALSKSQVMHTLGYVGWLGVH